MHWRTRRKIVSMVTLSGALGIAQPQHQPPIAEIKAILHEASALIPLIEPPLYRSTVAANIAGQLARAGDLEGALATLPVSVWDRDVGGIAYQLAAQGRLPRALQLVAATPDEQTRTTERWGIAQALLRGAKYEDALSVARLIAKDPKKAETFVGILMQIYAARWKAGDRQSASSILNEALSVAAREPEFDPRPSIPFFWIYSYRPRMYERIAHTLVLAGNRDGAATVVAHISVMAAGEQDSDKKMCILGPLASAQADLGDFTAALKTADLLKSEMEHEFALQAIANEQARQGDVAAALATAAQLHQSDSLLQGIARTFEDSGDYDGARAAVDKMKGPGERASGLATLAWHQVDKDPAGAKITTGLAWEATRESKGEAPSHVYRNALEFTAAARARLGDVAGALKIINGPDIDSVWPLQNLIQFMVEAGKKDEALALSRSQKSRRSRAYSLLGVAQSLMDQLESANNKTSAP
jgi:hypothetical protein